MFLSSSSLPSVALTDSTPVTDETALVREPAKELLSSVDMIELDDSAATTLNDTVHV